MNSEVQQDRQAHAELDRRLARQLRRAKWDAWKRYYIAKLKRFFK